MHHSLIVSEMTVKDRRIVYRYPGWADLDGYMACMNEFHAESLRAHLWIPTSPLSRAETCDRLSGILKVMALKQGVYLFVDVDGSLSGMGWIATKAGMFGEGYATLGIQILARARGLGIGKQLMRMLENEALRLGAQAILLTVAEANPAKDMYAALGYREIGRKPYFIGTNFGKQPFHERSALLEMMKSLEP